MPIVYIPLYIYFLWCALRARSLFFFSASNPGIENGGMLGESKFPILQKIELKPITLRFAPATDPEQIMEEINRAEIAYPLIFKPDIGERGWGVKKVSSTDDLIAYQKWCKVPFLVQEFVDLPIEAGVFYHRFPGEDKGKITSIVVKEMLSVEGDGVSTLRELITKSDRAFLQLPRLQKIWGDKLEEIIEEGKTIELAGIGNHVLGTKFLDGTPKVTSKMEESFDEIASTIDGFYFGRFDLRCASIEDLESGNILIMELNGAGAEPAHIYQPGFSWLKGQMALLHHMYLLFAISRANHRLGVKYMSFKEGSYEFRKIQKYNRTFKYD